jgi:hypothetical protein
LPLEPTAPVSIEGLTLIVTAILGYITKRQGLRLQKLIVQSFCWVSVPDAVVVSGPFRALWHLTHSEELLDSDRNGPHKFSDYEDDP